MPGLLEDSPRVTSAVTRLIPKVSVARLGVWPWAEGRARPQPPPPTTGRGQGAGTGPRLLRWPPRWPGCDAWWQWRGQLRSLQCWLFTVSSTCSRIPQSWRGPASPWGAVTPLALGRINAIVLLVLLCPGPRSEQEGHQRTRFMGKSRGKADSVFTPQLKVGRFRGEPGSPLGSCG